MRKVSVIIPILTESALLRKCVFNIVFQSYQNIEVVLVNGIPSYSARQLCNALAGEYRGVKVVQGAQSSFFQACNAGLEACGGDFVMFLNVTNWLHPELINIMLPAMEAFGVSVIECETKEITNINFPMPNLAPFTASLSSVKTVISSYLANKKHFPVIYNKLFRKGFINELSFQSIRSNEEFVNRLLRHSDLTAHINVPLVYCFKSACGNYITESSEKIAGIESLIERCGMVKQLYPALLDLQIGLMVDAACENIQVAASSEKAQWFEFCMELVRLLLTRYDAIMGCAKVSKDKKDFIAQSQVNLVPALKNYCAAHKKREVHYEI